MDPIIFELQQECCEQLSLGNDVFVIISIGQVTNLPPTFSVKVAAVEDKKLIVKGCLPQSTSSAKQAEIWAKNISKVDPRIRIHTDGLISTYPS